MAAPLATAGVAALKPLTGATASGTFDRGQLQGSAHRAISPCSECPISLSAMVRPSSGTIRVERGQVRESRPRDRRSSLARPLRRAWLRRLEAVDEIAQRVPRGFAVIAGLEGFYRFVCEICILLAVGLSGRDRMRDLLNEALRGGYRVDLSQYCFSVSPTSERKPWDSGACWT